MLDQIKTPDDLRALPAHELDALAQAVRDEIIEVCARNGGHLGASLGTVELCLALHRIFESPSDALVFDVGHQAYTHKLLTGRQDIFQNLRKAEGAPGEKIFTFKMNTYGSHINAELSRLDSPERGAHILRHTCAVWLLHYEQCERQKVRDFCRWKQERSMAGYGKRHLLVKNEGRMTPEMKARGAWLWESLRERSGLPDPEERLRALAILSGEAETTSACPSLPEAPTA